MRLWIRLQCSHVQRWGLGEVTGSWRFWPHQWATCLGVVKTLQSGALRKAYEEASHWGDALEGYSLSPAFAFSFCFQSPWRETLAPPHTPCHDAPPPWQCSQPIMDRNLWTYMSQIKSSLLHIDFLMDLSWVIEALGMIPSITWNRCDGACWWSQHAGERRR